MKAGYFDASKEIISGNDWPLIKDELSRVFTFLHEEEIGSGIVRFHGESELFETMPEGGSRKYDCIFTTDPETRKPKFDKFIPI